MKKTLLILGLLLVLLLAVMIGKTYLTPSKQIKTQTTALADVPQNSIQHLSGAIQFPTISSMDTTQIDTNAFGSFHRYLQSTFPLVHQHLQKKTFSRYGILFSWQGSNPQLKPAIFLAHMDVVPVEADKWAFPPFCGQINDGYIQGRGTLDDKGSLMSILEAVEWQLAQGLQPERTIMLAFGHDEEVSGQFGAGQISAYLAQQGVQAEFVIDEGMVITNGIVPMIEQPVAMIATSEKGYTSVKISVQYNGGHSSMPEKESAVTIIADAVAKLNAEQFPPTFCDPTQQFVNFIGPEMPLAARVIFANAWLTSPLIKSIYTASASGNALMRTTTAPTIMQAGMQDNVIPAYAEATINFRTLPNCSSDDVVNHIKKVVHDERIHIEKIMGVREAAAVSPVETASFAAIQKTISQTFTNALVAPTLMLASSDSRQYAAVSENIYRFAPYNLTSEDLAMIHGLDEKIKISDYEKMIEFYFRLIGNCSVEL